ncbi:MAG TPA: D-Ala-D-Ala carboxypeptidase family metallohydrolase [Beijerinckiaceae bacterium]|nr:D-Ala-D-Ala carboxypeptidase family metallohydrolase [Beijerinckiaceae bacterium]
MSPPLSLRRPPRAQRRRRIPLSPWHYLGAALLALVGTGVIAVLDRSKNGNGGQSASVQVAKALDSAAKPPAPDPARPVADATVTQSTTRAAAPTTSVPAAAPRSLFAELPAVPESSAPPEGPAVTASVAAVAPPPRQPAAQAPAPAPAASGQPGAAALQAAVTRRSVAVNANAATDCLPDDIRALLAEVGRQFGPITIVSTNKHMTGNHSAGSVREKHHLDCRAVDFKPDRHRVEAIKTYLRDRSEISGVDSYRSGMIHIDFHTTRSAGRAAPPTRAAAAASAQALEAPAEEPAAPPQPPSPFTPALPPWQR